MDHHAEQRAVDLPSRAERRRAREAGRRRADVVARDEPCWRTDSDERGRILTGLFERVPALITSGSPPIGRKCAAAGAVASPRLTGTPLHAK